MIYDTLIIGKGCAGYTAAVYCARYKLNIFLIGAEEGGMGNTAAEVGNWPGDEEVKGPVLMERMKDHAESFDTVTSKTGHVHSIAKQNNIFTAILDGKEEVQAKTIIYATGSNKRHLGAPGEQEFSGKGVTYCATCDAFFFRGKDVAVLGGGDAAVEGAAIVAQVANKVYLVHRRDTFRAEPYWVEKVQQKDNIEFVLNTNVTKIIGENVVTGIALDKPFKGNSIITVQGVFIEIGSTPATKLALEVGCEVDERGFLKVKPNQESTVSGFFAAGDVTNASNHFAQFTTAAGEASVASNGVFTYLQEQN
jgi:thioredoxin reductase (NADPH)